uniref:AsIV-cont00115-ORF1 n=1 Tax=Apophua simplicipes ichnovirus TaxID=1329648 RepID=S5DMP2_9VIRU|nr:AsIV-cont00115-ORF1 [Apophua simplicipes ichnovirus]
MSNTFRLSSYHGDSVSFQNGLVDEEKFIIMKTPKNGEEGDFLDFMKEQSVHFVVMMRDFILSDIEEVNCYWGELLRLPHVSSKFEVEHIRFCDTGSYSLRWFKFRRRESGEAFHEFGFFYFCKLDRDDVPLDSNDFLSFVTNTTREYREMKKSKSVCRIIVHSDSGAGLAALYTTIEIGTEDVLCRGRSSEILRAVKKNPHLRYITRKQMFFAHRALRDL